jgi:ketosteroid isomerase-like protein
VSGERSRVVRDYFDACNAGGIDALLAVLDEDVVHYFLQPDHPTIRGALHLARHWAKFKRVLAPVWRIDRLAESAGEVAGEWSCAYTPPGGAERRMFRGSEWYAFRAGRIAEIRAYYAYDTTRDRELADFDYAARGYLTKSDGATHGPEGAP